MRKIIVALLLSCFMLFGAACTDAFESESSGNDGKIVVSEIPETATAELGERFDIPEVTAMKGEVELTVTVIVKDSNGGDVELQGRGTRFSVEDPAGYTITFIVGEGDEKIEKTMTVSVLDTKGPELELPADAYNLTAKKGEQVSVPAANWTDKGGEVKEQTYTVTFNGEEVTVTDDTFTAAEYGDYVITYSAKDMLDHETVVEITVSCSRTVVLNDFNDESTVWVAGEAEPVFTEENAVEGTALKFHAKDAVTWQMLAVYPKYYDLSGFDKFQLTVYAENAMDTSDEGLYLLNQRYPLAEGKNVVTIDKEQFCSQYPNGRIPSNLKPEYVANMFIWFQLKAASGNIWIDNFVGIYSNYTEDTAAPVIDLGNLAPLDKMSVSEGRKLTVPAAVAYDNSLEENIPVTLTVKNSAGEDITSAAAGGNFIAQRDEQYSLIYTASDAAGNVSTKTVTVSVEPKSVIPDTAKEEYFPKEGVHYDVLNGLEGSNHGWTGNMELSYEAEHALQGEKSIRLSSANGNNAFVLFLLKDGKRINNKNWAKYEYVQLYVFAESEGISFFVYEKRYELAMGPNVIKVPSADILAEIERSETLSPHAYDVEGGFYFQYTAGTIYVDAIIGVYPEGYDPSQDPDEPIEIEVPEEIKNYYPAEGVYYDVLNDFETATVDTWFFPGSEGVSEKVIVDGKSFHITAEKAGWSKLPVIIKKNGNLLTEKDWKAYEKIKIAIYSGSVCTFAYLNETFQLKEGYNVIEVSPNQIWKQIQSSAECYPESGYFYCQVNGNDIDLYFDALIGVYPEGYDPSQQPEDPVEEELPENIKNYYPADRSYDVLNDFESANAIDTWFFNTSEGLSTKHSVDKDGHSFRVTGNAAWSKLPVIMKKNGAVLTKEDWAKYEKISLVIYSEGACTFAFLNHQISLVKGFNVVTVTSAEILAQINSNAECYPASGYFYCQLAGGEVDLYFDALIGIYPEGYDPSKEPDIPVEEDPDLAKDEYFPKEGVKYDMLNDFEQTGMDWITVTKSYETKHAMSGEYSAKLSTEGKWQCCILKMLKDGAVLTEADWNAYEKIQIYVYSENEGGSFWVHNTEYTLKKGANVITVTPAVILAEIASASNTYDSTGGFYFQLSEATVYVDAIIGIYPEA